MNEKMDWDRSLEWVLVKTFHHQFDVVVILDNPLSVQTLMSLRKLVPRIQAMPISELKSNLAGLTEYKVGTFNGQECRDLEVVAEELDLRLNITNCSYTSYLPIDKTNDLMWVIEDNEEAARIASEMIAAGVEVELCEAD